MTTFATLNVPSSLYTRQDDAAEFLISFVDDVVIYQEIDALVFDMDIEG